jgi:DNA-binding HxlR family transcriptional regulator
LTTNNHIENDNNCPAETLLKALSGKWKPQIFRLALEGPVRFSNLLRDIAGANKQSISTALRELEEENLLVKNIISNKPLHIEYNLSERGRALIPVFKQLELL